MRRVYFTRNLIPEFEEYLQARDDRQARLWYTQERAKYMADHQSRSAEGSLTQSPSGIHGPQWFNLKMDGRLVDVLVDENGQVVDQRPTKHL